MKNITILSFTIAAIFCFSCGSSNQKDSNEKTKGAGNVYEDENLSVTMGDGWNMKKGPDGHKFYTWKIESSGDIYKDMEDQYSEDQDKALEVVVDGLPALTKLKTYQQNETIKERVWLIYNGYDVISFHVMAPLTSYNDSEAMKVIKWVKIKNREANVELPKIKSNKFTKPDHFPEKMVELLHNKFSKEAVLSDKALENAINFTELMHNLDSTQINLKKTNEQDKMKVLDSLAITQDLKSWSHYEHIVKSAGAAIDPLLKFMYDLENMEPNSENYKLTLDATKQIMEQVRVSVEDLHYIYDNWEKASEFAEALNM